MLKFVHAKTKCNINQSKTHRGSLHRIFRFEHSTHARSTCVRLPASGASAFTTAAIGSCMMSDNGHTVVGRSTERASKLQGAQSQSFATNDYPISAGVKRSTTLTKSSNTLTCHTDAVLTKENAKGKTPRVGKRHLKAQLKSKIAFPV